MWGNIFRIYIWYDINSIPRKPNICSCCRDQGLWPSAFICRCLLYTEKVHFTTSRCIPRVSPCTSVGPSLLLLLKHSSTGCIRCYWEHQVIQTPVLTLYGQQSANLTLWCSTNDQLAHAAFMHQRDHMRWMHSWRVCMIHKCSADELLSSGALVHHEDKCRWDLRHHTFLTGLVLQLRGQGPGARLRRC